MKATTNPLLGMVAAALGWYEGRVESSSRPGLWHTVSIRRDTGECRCTCEGFRHHFAREHPTIWSERVCRHIAGNRMRLTAFVLGTEEPVLVAVIEPSTRWHARYQVSYWFGETEIHLDPACLHCGDHASDIRARLGIVRRHAGFPVRAIDLTGEDLLEQTR